ncbi:MAG: IPTL-CTERM sorting domain-containing protein [Pseudomonadota bacterium]
MHALFVRFVCLTLLLSIWGSGAVRSAEIPAVALQRLDGGGAVELIVEYQSGTLEEELASRRKAPGRTADPVEIQGLRVERYTNVRNRVDDAMGLAPSARLKDYAQLPMSFRRFRSLAEAQAYAAHPDVKAVHENIRLVTMLTQSLPLVEQPAVAAATTAGSGTTIAVIDNGINYTHSAFGSCTAPGVPAGCKVVASVDFGTGTTDKNHGTNVSAIALGVAPASRIAMLNAFSGTSAWTSDIIEAIDWAIANRTTYNIVAINMSLGESNFWINVACTTNNPFLTPVTNARNVGIAVIASAGNEAHKDGITRPACTPGVISVGAVYDANVGGLSWGSGLCTDSTTTADKVACFSNSASILTLLAPGALIAAAGISMGGTSQAAPHVAGAVAVLRSLYPSESLDQIQARLTSTGKPVTDPGNGISKPRLALLAAARPQNDAFAAAVAISGLSGSVSGQSLVASKETGEPNHAGDAGGRSVWWKWVAPASGQFSLNSHGSGFDTLLAVYIGTGVGALTPVAANDNDSEATDGSSRVLFQAEAGTEYRIALDGFAGESGSAVLNWQLNTAAQSNLSLGITGSSTGPDTASYSIVVANAGPQTATDVSATIVLPANASFMSASPECVPNGAQVVCAIGTLASGGNVVFTLQLSWTSGASYQIAASVQSDVPDPLSTDNAQALAIVLGESVDGDVPTLPEWGMILMLALFGGFAARGRAWNGR